MDNLPNTILWIGRLFGSLPLESISGPKNIKRLTFSLTGFICSLALFMLQEVLCCIVLYMNAMKEMSNSRAIKFAMVLDIVSLQTVAAVTFFTGTRKYPKIIGVLSTLQRAYRDLQYTKREDKTRVKVFVITIISTLLFSISFVNLVISDLEVVHFFAISYTSIMLINCTEIAFLLHFTHVAKNIAIGFRMLNFKIKEEITKSIIQPTEMNHNPFDADSIHKRLFDSMIVENVFSKIKKMKSLMNTYWMLCDAVHQANDFYCDQLMAVVFSLFVHVTIKSYFFFLHVRAGEVFASTTETAWVLAHICYELLLFKLSTEVTNSADETGPVICKLINKDVDPNLRKELEGFLLQLPHHHARFSARGFFQIHNETLTSMAGAVTTYLVILIQFQTQPPSKID
ncbi:gustatory receptor [Homalodisca vitripennis]|nr:gustatory receptor [Homalodisca vitripennis]